MTRPAPRPTAEDPSGVEAAGDASAGGFDRRWLGLTLIVAVYSALGLAYAATIPRWQSPDEPAHFNYIEELAETGNLPVLEPGDYDGPYLETLKARGFPDNLPVDEVRYEGHQPPLYYLGGAGVYELAPPADTGAQVAALRAYSVALGALALVVTFLVSRLLLPGFLALGPPAFVATVPQHLAITASINNDVAAELGMGVLLFALLGAIQPAGSALERGSKLAAWLSRPVPLGIILGLLILTKTTLYIGVALVPLALALGAGRDLASRWPAVLRGSVLTYAVALVVASWWLIRNLAVYGPTDPLAQTRHDLVVTGQPATEPSAEAVGFFAGTLFRSFWGQFGWMGVPLDERSYLFAGVLSAALVAGAALWCVRALRRRPLSSWENRRLLLLGAALVLLFLGVVAYNLKYIQPQGRYLFSALAPLGVFATLGLRGWLTDRWASIGLAALYPILVAFDLWALLRVIRGAFA